MWWSRNWATYLIVLSQFFFNIIFTFQTLEMNDSACTDCFWEVHIWRFSLSNSLALFKSFQVLWKSQSRLSSLWSVKQAKYFVPRLWSFFTSFTFQHYGNEWSKLCWLILENTQWTMFIEHLWFFFRILKLKKFLSKDTHYDEFMVIGQVPAGKLLVRGQENSRKKEGIFRPKACWEFHHASPATCSL